MSTLFLPSNFLIKSFVPLPLSSFTLLHLTCTVNGMICSLHNCTRRDMISKPVETHLENKLHFNHCLSSRVLESFTGNFCASFSLHKRSCADCTNTDQEGHVITMLMLDTRGGVCLFRSFDTLSPKSTTGNWCLPPGKVVWFPGLQKPPELL